MRLVISDHKTKSNIMKKIFTLLTGFLMAVAVMAADRGPDLTVRTAKNYKIVIDGRTYFSSNSILRVNNLQRGMHKIQVFEMRNGYGFFGKRERLVSATTFRINKRDVRILVDHAGRINVIKEQDIDPNDRGWNDRNNRDRDFNDRDDRRDGRRDDNRRY